MLTDAAIRRAKAGEKDFKLSDSGGLYLLVTTSGSRLWRLKYRFGGKEKLLALGAYPETTLLAAREARDAAKRVLAEGQDPSVRRRVLAAAAASEAGDTFEVLAREWHTLKAPTWGEVHAGNVLHSLEAWVFPYIGAIPVRQITPPVVLEVCRKIEARPAIETARRVRQRISAVFVHAIASGRAEQDPAAVVLKALAPVVKGKMPAVLTMKHMRQVLIDAEATPAHPVTRLALRFLALTVVRPGTLRFTPWTELDAVDPEERVWIIPAERMKLTLQNKQDEARDHLVPLSEQAMDIIAALRPLTGRSRWVFPGDRHFHKPMSENALSSHLNRAGYYSRHVPHGWRSSFSTAMNELYRHDHKVIDLMLAHVPKEKVEATYNRAAYLPRRRELAQEWADLLLEGMPAPAEILYLPRKSRNYLLHSDE